MDNNSVNEQVRKSLDKLIRDKGDDYASISALIGRNSSYIQQFIKRGSPKNLSESDRRVLANHFNVPESILGAPDFDNPQPVPFMLRNIENRELSPLIPFLGINKNTPNPDSLKVYRIISNDMAPTLNSGDTVVIDVSETTATRDGIYYWRGEHGSYIRRLTFDPLVVRFILSCDNPAHPRITHSNEAKPKVDGRLIWIGKCLE